jgi:hypothetical protein
MKRKSTWSMTMALCGLLVSGCGDVKSEPADGDTDDVTPPDGVDTSTDTPPDTGTDTPPDTSPDTLLDTAEDSGEDVIDDTMEPDGEDVIEEVTTQCEDDGGYCTTYAATDGCVQCPDVGSIHYEPARAREGEMECTTSTGDEPYCCLPVDMSDPTECETGGGACYNRGGSGGEICAPGWVESTTMSCRGSHVCCEPGPTCP